MRRKTHKSEMCCCDPCELQHANMYAESTDVVHYGYSQKPRKGLRAMDVRNIHRLGKNQYFCYVCVAGACKCVTQIQTNIYIGTRGDEMEKNEYRIFLLLWQSHRGNFLASVIVLRPVIQPVQTIPTACYMNHGSRFRQRIIWVQTRPSLINSIFMYTVNMAAKTLVSEAKSSKTDQETDKWETRDHLRFMVVLMTWLAVWILRVLTCPLYNHLGGFSSVGLFDSSSSLSSSSSLYPCHLVVLHFFTRFSSL
ncbi:hypothetical protein Dsin_009439 [Dipteronia sinensis]|uniref:Uncharacterized protein n=1 Tax=Dipteronia sinensis TaxID=43782 RepID=A0AAE0EBX3_9ROSI|nr:hypothetical protein Dsin_009439 [Dipteronia sinensis]